MQITIDKDVPLPPARNNKYPFLDMAVGDSFSLPETERNRASSSAALFGKRHGKKFSIKANRSEGTIRVWRVA